MLQRSSAEFKQIVIHRILTNGPNEGRGGELQWQMLGFHQEQHKQGANHGFAQLPSPAADSEPCLDFVSNVDSFLSYGGKKHQFPSIHPYLHVIWCKSAKAWREGF